MQPSSGLFSSIQCCFKVGESILDFGDIEEGIKIPKLTYVTKFHLIFFIIKRHLYFSSIYIYICFPGDGKGGVTGNIESKDRGLTSTRICLAG